ncbi:hypothetical protein BDV37DRAFT_124231 [Aspergillus pseudonomiae]|uniref:Uncharacterized protein n=1 Tax=Aspergillus pseudonomiae TaxID=1506151 RepID=A0A5N7DBS1_9EURO|nr:uncharacterized protein BDV37DRAFT_124231 [Aspergillus pseudonomiae]KAE8403842.1 hypothetical protein BDV37DRAFT_124231 [Aspergillus pseudonomiae]
MDVFQVTNAIPTLGELDGLGYGLEKRLKIKKKIKKKKRHEVIWNGFNRVLIGILRLESPPCSYLFLYQVKGLKFYNKHIAGPGSMTPFFPETKADWYQFSRNSAYCASSINLTKKRTQKTHIIKPLRPAHAKIKAFASPIHVYKRQQKIGG